MLLVSPGYSGIEFTDPYVLEQTAAMVKAAADRDAAAFVEAFLRAWVDGPRRLPADVDPAVRARCREMAMTAASRGLGRTGTLREVGAADRLDELSMPVDVVVGDLDSADITAAGERIVTAARDSRVDTIVAATHVLNLDQPEAFGVVLRKFVNVRAARRN